MAIRKLIAFGFSVVGGVVLLASIAYACIPFYGDLTVTGPGKSGERVVGGNDGVSHTYCRPADDTNVNNFVPGSAYAAATRGNLITVSVSEANTDCPDFDGFNRLPGGNYTVILNNATSAGGVPWHSASGSWSFKTGTGCFFGSGPAGNITLTNNFSINGSGNGASVGVFSLSTTNRTDGTNEASSLCVGGNSKGIFAPIKITHTV